MFLFGRKSRSSHTGRRKKAAAFVDFEHWYISLYKNFGMKPDIKGWYNDISCRYDLTDVYFFADFSNLSLRGEIPKIREITTNIIETQNAAPHHKKDFTDFIMLDHIYQSAFHDDIDAFVIFTGDGHFSSVVSYLTAKRRKEVAVYGIRNAISNSLKNTATYCFALPTEQQVRKARYSLIIKAISDLYEANKNARPTFTKTIESVARANGLKEEEVAQYMQELVDKGYVYQKRKYFQDGNFVKILALNTELIKLDKITDLR